MELDKKTTYKIAALLAFGVILYLGLNNWHIVVGILRYWYQLIFPFILGGAIAFILNIPMSLIEKKLSEIKVKKIGSFIKKGSRVISLILSCFFVVGVIALVLALVIPQLVDTAKLLPKTFEHSVKNLQKWVEDSSWVSGEITNWINSMKIDWVNIFGDVKTTLFDGASSMLVSTIGVATSFASGVVNFILGFVFAVYILMQKEKLGVQCKKVLYAYLPADKAKSILELAALTSKTFSNFVSGQCTEAVILGLMFFITMTIFRIPYAITISVLIACTALIPVLGSFIGCAVGIFLIVIVSPGKALLFIILFLVLQQIEGNVVYPRVVGNSVGLPSLWVLVAITIGGKMMGVAGMIIFIPLFSVAYVLFRKEVYRRLEKKRIKVN